MNPSRGEASSSIRLLKSSTESFCGRTCSAATSGTPRKFGKESPLRQQLVLHDVGDRTGTRMRAVAKIRINKGRPDGNDFIRLAGVGIEDVLKEWNPAARNLFVANRRERIFHKCNVTLAYCAPEAGSIPA